ncbi:MAG: helix-turn-helix domain-containing protein [Alphaproteobacteria bacterium]|nr:helix-turn-helix domain-containing protein [Alphaproteobacteria bacterium]
MYETQVSYFKSEYDKNIVLYGKQTIYEPLPISEDKLLNEIKWQTGLTSRQICFGVRTALNYNPLQKDSTRPVIIFERISFSIEQCDLIRKLLTQKIDYEDRQVNVDVFFINCHFSTPIVITEPVETDVCFRGCKFSRDCVFKCDISGHLIFTDCKFRDRLDFEDASISQMFFIEGCFFDKNSLFNLSNAKLKSRAKCIIKNTQFAGRFEAQGAEISSFSVFSNISFFNVFNFNQTKFNGHCIFDNIAFAHPTSQAIVEAQKIWAKALEKSGCEKEIANLGLNIAQNIDDTEEREYQDALQKGWLNPKQAARFLGKSVRTLQEKRKNDQMQITKESLPFKGVGRDIVYPLDALKAYLEQDWNLLKELRKKHWKKD